jgi:ABC-type Na+ transport system ATPase subunit NatA
MRDSTDPVIAIRSLSRRFGSKTALNDVWLDVPRGSVFGLVGENGAGKTTLIKHILGLLRAESGTVRVFGLDPVSEPVEVLGRVGYLSEQPDLPDWMRVHEFMRYTQAFYPKWDARYAEQLREQFGLDPSARLRVLSKGQRAKLGLLAAQAHRPDLLLLDEPSSGLDPIVRRDILEAVIRTVSDEGRSVFAFSAVPYVVGPLFVLPMILIAERPILSWIQDNSDRWLPAMVWTAAGAGLVKFWLAAFSWRKIKAPNVLRYLVLWLGGTACCVGLAFLLADLLGSVLATDTYRLRNLLILIAMQIVPLGRLGLAPVLLDKNRHR